MLADDEEIEQAQEEGVKVYSGYTNSGFNVEDGRATGLNVVAVSSFKFGPNGLEVDIIPGTEEVVPCDVVVFASGQKTDLTADFGLELNRLGYPIDPATGKSGNKTSLEGVFTAGDVITGTKAVIDAIAGGRTAAEVIGRRRQHRRAPGRPAPRRPLHRQDRGLCQLRPDQAGHPLLRGAPGQLRPGGQLLLRGHGPVRGGPLPEVPAALPAPQAQDVDCLRKVIRREWDHDQELREDR